MQSIGRSVRPAFLLEMLVQQCLQDLRCNFRTINK